MEGLTVEQQKEYDASMEACMREQLEQEHKDSRILNRIKNYMSKSAFESLRCELDEGEHPSNYRIVDEPTGTPQISENDITLWVDQYTGGGYSGDSWAGTACIKLPNGKYFMWDYWT